MKPAQTKRSNITGIQALILDMDGVLWPIQEPVGEIPKIFTRIQSLGLKVVLATNDTMLSVAQYLERFSRLGVELESWQIVNSAQATARYLKTRFPSGGPVYMVGEEALTASLVEAGFYPSDQDPLAVVVALDRELTYDKLRVASSWIQTGAAFIAADPDPTFPAPEGSIPGAGAIVAALVAATNVQPTIIGKHSPEMYQLALERLALPPERVLVVGDRLATGIAGVLSEVIEKLAEAKASWK